MDAATDGPLPDTAIPETGADVVSDAIPDTVVTTLCPEEPPSLGNGCAVPGQVCAYATGEKGPCDDAGQNDRVAWRCQDGGWLEIARCVKWSACPGDPPAIGDPCDGDTTGLDCFYSADDVCAPSSIAQCDGVQWQHVNACPHRSVPGAFSLVHTEPSVDLTAVTHPQQQVSYPAVALAGTQMLMTYSVSAGMLPDHGTYGHFLQTAVPSQASPYSPSDDDLWGADSVSNPCVTRSGGRFLLAWAANDGWPVHTGGVPGTYVRTVPLHEPPHSSLLVEESGSAPTAIVMQPGGGRMAYRHASEEDPSKHAASVVVLSDTGEPAPMTKETLADETSSHGFVLPVPRAFVRMERWQDGFVYAYPVTATGDAWDDSGIMVEFHESANPNGEPVKVRLTVGMPRRASVATLRDGSVVVAHRRAGDDLGPPFRLARAWADGTWEELTDPPQTGVDETLGSGPVIVPFEDGFAVAWTSMPFEAPTAEGWPRAFVRVGGDLSYEQWWSSSAVMGLGPSDLIALSYGVVDRSLHLAWSRNTGGLSTIERQRLVVLPH